MNGVCSFCGREVMYGGMEFGGSFLHDDCYTAVQREMNEDLTVVVESTPLLEKVENDERVEEFAGWEF